MSKKMSYDTITIHNAVFYAYHGVLSDEQNLGGKFEVDVELKCDLSKGIKSDHLSDTINYVQVYDYIRQLVVERKHYLIESLAGMIAEGLLKKYKSLVSVVVRVRKVNAPVRGVIGHVEAEITRWRKGRRSR